MIVYRQQQRAAESLPLLKDLHRQIDELGAHCRPSREQIVHALIDAGEFASAIADARAPQRDTIDEAGEACTELTLHLGDASVAAYYVRERDVSAALGRAAFMASRVASLDLPGTVRRSVSEGFAYYALGPELYSEAALAWARQSQPAVVWCIGLRTIGLTLAAVTAAALRSQGVIARVLSVRPRGHPFDRCIRVDAAVDGVVTSIPEAWWLVIDEGPGLSGSSIAGTARWLASLAIPHDRIVLMPGHAPDVSRLSPQTRQEWDRHTVWPAGGEDTWLSTARLARYWDATAVRDIGGGAWRDIRRLDGPMPAVHPHHERRKYIMHRDDERTFLKFAGYGRYGADVVNRALHAADEGWSPAPRRARDGWIELPWMDERFGVGRPSPGDLAHLAGYLAFVARTRLTGHRTDTDALFETTHANLRELCGDQAADAVEAIPVPNEAPSVVLDARLRQHEWVRQHGRLKKLDGVEHGDDHFFPGPGDIAWDLAGAIEEWALADAQAAYFIDRFIAATGDGGVRQRLPFYRIAYLACRAAYTAFCRDQLRAAPDAARFAREHDGYRTRLQRLLRCAC